MAQYLEQGDEIAPEQLHAPFEKALREGHLIPVCFVSARTGAGVAELLDVFVKLAAEPDRGQPAAVLQGRGRREPSEFRSEPDPTQARARARVQGRRRPVRRQARRLPRPPGHGHQGHAALHRRRPQAVQGRAPVHAAGRQERRDRPRGARRHRRRGQGRRDRLRLRAARLARRGPHPHAAARVPDADARPRDRRRRSAATSSGSPTSCTR